MINYEKDLHKYYTYNISEISIFYNFNLTLHFYTN